MARNLGSISVLIITTLLTWNLITPSESRYLVYIGKEPVIQQGSVNTAKNTKPEPKPKPTGELLFVSKTRGSSGADGGTGWAPCCE